MESPAHRLHQPLDGAAETHAAMASRSGTDRPDGAATGAGEAASNGGAAAWEHLAALDELSDDLSALLHQARRDAAYARYHGTPKTLRHYLLKAAVLVELKKVVARKKSKGPRGAIK